jgi:PAS domain S-box-containing protein
MKHTIADFSVDEYFYQSIYENIMDAVLYTVPDGRVLFANPAACALFGMTIQEINERGRAGLLDQDDPRLPNLLKERNLQGKVKGELVWVKKDGTKFPGEFSSSVFKTSNGEERTCIVIHDLTEIRKVENELRESEIRFRLALDVTNEGIWDYSNAEDHVFFSVSALKIAGFDEHQKLTPKNAFSIVHTDDLDQVRENIRGVISTRKDLLDVEFRIKTSSNELKWIRAKGKIIERNQVNGCFRMIGTFTDITDRKKAEDELRKSKEGFRSYFYNGPVAMCVNSSENTWMEINQEFCRLVGYEKEELFAMNWEKITHPDDIKANQELIQKMKDGELDHFKLDKRYIRKDGAIIYATLSLVSSRNADGSLDYVIVSFIDNTEHFKAVENLVQERHLLRTLVDNLPFPIYFIDKDGKKVIANKADLENIGCADEREVLGKTDEVLFPNEVGKRGHADNLTVLQTGNPILNREEDFINVKGEQRWLQTTKIPLFDTNHQITGLVGIGLDVTQQRMLQQKIKESEAYYRSLVNVSPDGIIVTDPQGTVDFVSYKVYDIFGIPESTNLIGDSIFNWIAPESLEFSKVNFQNVLSGMLKTPSQEFKCRKFDGSIFWGESASTLLEDSDGDIKGTMIVFRDISDRKQAEEEILLAKNKVEESDRLKSAFLQNISHEIRTPMNSIIGFLEILEDPNFSRNEKKMYANIVNKSGHRLLNTIHDIVEISKIMTSNVEVNSDVLEIKEFIQEHFQNFKPLVDEKGLTFTFDCKLAETLRIRTDQRKLGTALYKILDNALKFTNEGGIVLGLKKQDKTLCFKVQDTGIGIEPKKLSSIFQPFYQTDQEYSRKYEGAGLGLSISKAYIEMLGGKIWIESNPDIGSTVYFSIPLENNAQ